MGEKGFSRAGFLGRRQYEIAANGG